MVYKNKKLLFLVIFMIISILISVPSIFLYQGMQDSFVEEVGNKAVDTASAIAGFIENDVDNYEMLINRKDAAYQEYYADMLSVFQKLKSNTDADYIFTENYISDEKIEYILDAENPNSENFSPIGSIDSMSEVELDAFKSGKRLHTGIIDDPYWGYFLTGFAPIKDNTGTVVGLVGVDYSLAQIRAIMNEFLTILSIGVLVLSIALTMFIHKIIYERFEAKSIDYLTGLYTRYYFEAKLQQEVKRRKKDDLKPLSILMVDVDDFKEINDEYGHPIGDQALKMVAAIIQHSSRDNDICARYGGDEFILALPGATRDEAVDVCNRILRKIKEAHLVSNNQNELGISLSIGIAEWKSHMSPAELISKADSMLLISKTNGKGKYTI